MPSAGIPSLSFFFVYSKGSCQKHISSSRSLIQRLFFWTFTQRLNFRLICYTKCLGFHNTKPRKRELNRWCDIPSPRMVVEMTREVLNTWASNHATRVAFTGPGNMTATLSTSQTVPEPAYSKESHEDENTTDSRNSFLLSPGLLRSPRKEQMI